MDTEKIKNGECWKRGGGGLIEAAGDLQVASDNIDLTIGRVSYPELRLVEYLRERERERRLVWKGPEHMLHLVNYTNNNAPSLWCDCHCSCIYVYTHKCVQSMCIMRDAGCRVWICGMSPTPVWDFNEYV